MPFTVTTQAFRDGDPIPVAFTCDGDNQPPPLEWANAPRGTRSFALVVDDPDAPGGTFTHWLLYDIPGTATALVDPAHGRTLRNDFGRAGYGGPCPPRGHGPHRYCFTLYALDTPSLTLSGKNRAALERALREHSLGTARLTGHYER